MGASHQVESFDGKFIIRMSHGSALAKFRVGTFNNISRVGLSKFRQSAYQVGALDSETDPISDPVSFGGASFSPG